MDEADLTRKIGALLAKAEGTDNAAEAEVFYGKAVELMAKYAIDEERVRAAARLHNGKVEEPVVEDYMFSSYAHHREAKQTLIEMCAKQQSVRFFRYSNRKDTNYQRVHEAGLTGLHESQWIKLVGYKADIERAKMLFLSLQIQATRAANNDWKDRYGDAAKTTSWEEGTIGKFTWLGSHMRAFSYRISERFDELKQAVIMENDGNALIIDKDANIQEWMYEHGLQRRPVPVASRCWKLQPEDDPSWPKTAKGLPNQKHRALYCVKYGTLDPTGQFTIPHEDPHAYTYDTGPYKASYYVAKGRTDSASARAAGRSAADRADIGLTRVGSSARAIKG